jgi:hypothetical protein
MNDDANQLDERETARLRDEVVKRMLNTPPKPQEKKGRKPKPAPED